MVRSHPIVFYITMTAQCERCRSNSLAEYLGLKVIINNQLYVEYCTSTYCRVQVLGQVPLRTNFFGNSYFFFEQACLGNWIIGGTEWRNQYICSKHSRVKEQQEVGFSVLFLRMTVWFRGRKRWIDYMQPVASCINCMYPYLSVCIYALCSSAWTLPIGVGRYR